MASMNYDLLYILLAITSSAALLIAVYLDARDWNARPSFILTTSLIFILGCGFLAGYFIKSEFPGWVGFCVATAFYMVSARGWRNHRRERGS